MKWTFENGHWYLWDRETDPDDDKALPLICVELRSAGVKAVYNGTYDFLFETETTIAALKVSLQMLADELLFMGSAEGARSGERPLPVR